MNELIEGMLETWRKCLCFPNSRATHTRDGGKQNKSHCVCGFLVDKSACAIRITLCMCVCAALTDC